MHISQAIHDLGAFVLAAIPVGGFMAQATDIIPNGWANMTAGAFAMVTAFFLWKHLEKKDKDQKEAQIAALQAKDDEIKRLADDLKTMRDVLLKDFQQRNHNETR
jgi:predicted outer membrane lipoprotein